MICTHCLPPSTRRYILSKLIRRQKSAFTFSSERKTLHRNRTVKFPDHTQFDYLRDGIAEILADRITDINRDYQTVVDLGSGKGHVYKYVNTYTTKRVIECDTAEACLELPRQPVEGLTTQQVLLEQDDKLPFEDSSQDIILSNLWMHWVNDLPKLFREVERVLVPDGVFIGAMFSGDSIYQLRVALQQAELERTGGIAPHVSPFVRPSDIGALLQSAKFCMTTLDSDVITITYPDMYFLLRDLQGMAENGSLTKAPNLLRRDVLLGAAALYHDLYANPDNSLPLSFSILYFIAWKQSPNQGVPRPRGSQTMSIGDLNKMFGDDSPKPTDR